MYTHIFANSQIEGLNSHVQIIHRIRPQTMTNLSLFSQNSKPQGLEEKHDRVRKKSQDLNLEKLALTTPPKRDVHK